VAQNVRSIKGRIENIQDIARPKGRGTESNELIRLDSAVGDS
jgi:hypothetical protein